jgi:glycosyltransferase involved in cell wall biosynthesis
VNTRERRRPLHILNLVRFPIGGIRSYLRYTYSRLEAESYTVTILAVDDKEVGLLPDSMAPVHVDLKVVSKQRPFLRLLLAAHRLIRTGRYDLVHSQGTTAAVAGAISARWYRVPHVVTLHETFRAEQFAGVFGGTKRRILARILGLADAIVVVGDDARKNLFEYIPLQPDAVRRVETIRNGVAVDALFREGKSRPGLRARWNVPDDVVLFGFMGRFMPEKGFDVLLEAVRLLKDSGAGLPKFLIVAANEGAFLREYRHQIVEAGLEPLFAFAGLQPSAAGMLQEVDAVVMPSRREACGLVAMEAIVLGCPLIASDCIGLREVTAGTPAFRSVAGDPASLAEAMKLFLHKRSEARATAEAFAPKARDAFDSVHTARSLAALFDRTLTYSGTRAVSHAG